jgi:hypothetical protein
VLRGRGKKEGVGVVRNAWERSQSIVEGPTEKKLEGARSRKASVPLDAKTSKKILRGERPFLLDRNKSSALKTIPEEFPEKELHSLESWEMRGNEKRLFQMSDKMYQKIIRSVDIKTDKNGTMEVALSPSSSRNGELILDLIDQDIVNNAKGEVSCDVLGHDGFAPDELLVRFPSQLRDEVVAAIVKIVEDASGYVGFGRGGLS